MVATLAINVHLHDMIHNTLHMIRLDERKDDENRVVPASQRHEVQTMSNQFAHTVFSFGVNDDETRNNSKYKYHQSIEQQ